MNLELVELRRRRKRVGLTQRGLAEETYNIEPPGISVQRIAFAETDRAKLRASEIALIRRAIKNRAMQIAEEFREFSEAA